MGNNEILNQLIQILLPTLATALTAVFTYIGTRLKRVYEEKINNETAKAVVHDAVRFVEQVYTDLKGQEKLEKATEHVSEILKAKGINITEAEINMLIESAVYGLNEGWFDKKENQQLMQDLKSLAAGIKSNSDTKYTITNTDTEYSLNENIEEEKED